MGFFNKIAGLFKGKSEQPEALEEIKPKALGYSHHGASHVKKALQGWWAPSGGPDADVVANLKELRARARDLFMGTPLATGALKAIRTNVVGSGLELSSSIDAAALGLTEEEADQWERHTEREWRLWSSSYECDAARRMSFGQIQGLVLLSALMSGDVFVSLPVIHRPGSVYSLRVQVIEGDKICDPAIKDVTKDILEGVEVGKNGEPVTYYIAKFHPDEPVRRGVNTLQEWKAVPAFGRKTGRRNLLHIMADVERPGQRRGIPIMSPVMEAVKQIGRYTDAELMAAVVSGMYTVFIKTEQPEDMIASGIPTEMQLPTTENDPTSYELGNGSIVGLGTGESIETANPTRPIAGFGPFVDAISTQIGAALEIPKDVLLKSFNASYSASRAALLEAWKMYGMRRDWLVRDLCRPVYEEWLAEAVAIGRINAPGFFSDPAIRAAWSRSEWFGPSQGAIDPTKEVTAAQMRVENGFSTRERETAELTGMNFDRVVEIRAREEALMQQAGLGDGTSSRAGDGSLSGVDAGFVQPDQTEQG